MNISAVVCVLLFLRAKGVWGSELTINVKRKDSVTLMCSNYEILKLCFCPPDSQRCRYCMDFNIRTSVTYSGLKVYYTLQGLEQKDSGLYVCYRPLVGTQGQVYKINVLEESPPPVLPRPQPPPDMLDLHPASSSSSPHNVGIIVMLSSVSLLIITLSIAVTRCKGLRRLRERFRLLFTRRTPLSAADIDASVYANSVANYYRQNHGQVIPADRLDQDDDKETSSSSDDEFEEWPVCPKKSSSASWEETDYVRVKPGVSAHSQDTGEVGYTKKTVSENVAQKNSEQSHDSDDEEDEVTYTHVTFKHRK